MGVNGACAGDVSCLQYKRVFTKSDVTITRVDCTSSGALFSCLEMFDQSSTVLGYTHCIS